MNLVAVKIDGDLTIHLPCHTGNYETLCGLAGDDDYCGQEPAKVPKGAKVNCPDCQGIYNICRIFKPSILS